MSTPCPEKDHCPLLSDSPAVAAASRDRDGKGSIHCLSNTTCMHTAFERSNVSTAAECCQQCGALKLCKVWEFVSKPDPKHRGTLLACASILHGMIRHNNFVSASAHVSFLVETRCRRLGLNRWCCWTGRQRQLPPQEGLRHNCATAGHDLWLEISLSRPRSSTATRGTSWRLQQCLPAAQASN